MTGPVQIGDLVYLGSYLTNTHVYGVVTPPDTPDQFSATFEIQGDQGTLTTNALQGPQGVPGQAMFALRLQISAIDDPDDLPTTLTNTEADWGKYWMIDDLDGDGNVIGSSAYIWFGTAYRKMQMGSPGPVGKTPQLNPVVNLLDPDDSSLSSNVQVTGPLLTPTITFNLKVPKGPQGTSGNLWQDPDVDNSTPPNPGDVLTFTGEFLSDGTTPIWKPMAVQNLTPAPYSVPESAFTSYSGLSQRATIGTFAIPPQAFKWVPIVWGQIGAAGLELSANPLLIGAEVRLGDPVTGTLVARGFGNSFGEVVLIPHFSAPSTPGTALTPTNTLARVPANHSSSAQGTLYVNLYNDGTTGVYQFNPRNAQLFVQVTPVS